MTDRALLSLVASATHALRGEAVAIGAAVSDVREFAWRGSLADELIHARTVFYSASVTKQIVGVAAAAAVIRRAIDVDDSIVQWVPELPSSMDAIQLGHLIHHTSGLPDVADRSTGAPRLATVKSFSASSSLMR